MSISAAGLGAVGGAEVRMTLEPMKDQAALKFASQHRVLHTDINTIRDSPGLRDVGERRQSLFGGLKL
jgi:hypothetical protein